MMIALKHFLLPARTKMDTSKNDENRELITLKANTNFPPNAEPIHILSTVVTSRAHYSVFFLLHRVTMSKRC